MATHKTKAQWLTFEYALAMGSLVASVLLTTAALTAVFGGWAGLGSALSHGGVSWLAHLFSVTMVTPATGLVATGVAAVLMALISFVFFGRVSKAIPEREGYTGRVAYKAVTYGGLAALVIPALALVAKLVAILLSSLLMIGVGNAGTVYGSLYIAEFLPYALSLGLMVVAIGAVGKIVNGKNTSKLLTIIALSASSAVLVAGMITVAVQAHDAGKSRVKDYSSQLKYDFDEAWRGR